MTVIYPCMYLFINLAMDSASSMHCLFHVLQIESPTTKDTVPPTENLLTKHKRQMTVKYSIDLQVLG